MSLFVRKKTIFNVIQIQSKIRIEQKQNDCLIEI
jgi:hypothetical protein